MTWWLRVHAAYGCATGLVLCFLLAPVLSASELPVPSLFSGLTGGIPVPLVLPVLPACLLLHSLDRPPFETEATASRRMHLWSTGLVATACTTAVLIAVAETLWLDFPLGVAVARNVIGYVGVGLLTQRLLGARYAPVVVALLPLVCALIGLGPGGRPYGWTWPLHGSDSPAAAVAALLLLGLGCAVHAKSVHAKRARR